MAKWKLWKWLITAGDSCDETTFSPLVTIMIGLLMLGTVFLLFVVVTHGEIIGERFW